MQKDLDDGLERRQEDVHWKLKHDGAQGASKDDHGRSGLGDLSDASTFDHHAGENADDGECDSTDAGDIHGSPLADEVDYSPEALRARSRRSWPASCADLALREDAASGHALRKTAAR